MSTDTERTIAPRSRREARLQRRRREGWWRLNRWSLPALAVLILATIGVIGGNEWNSYFSGRASIPVTVAAGGSAELAGTTWGPATAHRLDADETASLQPPSATRLLEVTVPVTPGATAVGCQRPVLRETDGAQRQWNDASGTLPRSAVNDQPSSCLADATGPYSIVVPFLLPENAEGPFVLDLAVTESLPRFLRLALIL